MAKWSQKLLHNSSFNLEFLGHNWILSTALPCHSHPHTTIKGKKKLWNQSTFNWGSGFNLGDTKTTQQKRANQKENQKQFLINTHVWRLASTFSWVLFHNSPCIFLLCSPFSYYKRKKKILNPWIFLSQSLNRDKQIIPCKSLGFIKVLVREIHAQEREKLRRILFRKFFRFLASLQFMKLTQQLKYQTPSASIAAEW